ncbi:fibronectin type III domain-containing protein, partial [Candidatus Microgenomates bacterium]|nr:fibronectin type III domain-containing protein [Candidatus Microgenomates bacterium]
AANPATYFNNGTSLTLSTGSLPNVNRGTNIVYVVAVDNAIPANYSPSNYISGIFTLNSAAPDNVDNLVLSDASIKYQEKWNVALTWTAPAYQGAGNLTYLIYRSADGVTFAQTGSTTGLSYVDTTPLSALYYYKIYTQDGAHALSSGTNSQMITPTGRWLTAPTLESVPVVSGITTKKAVITWSTNRTADSKVEYGTASGTYFTEEPSNANQVATHTINLTNLTPGTKYYYKVLWTDEDGNTGSSSEYSFTTDAAPYASSIKISNVSISSAYVTFSVTNAAKATINYGKTNAYGLAQSVSTNTTGSTYTINLTKLTEGTKYHLRITTEDNDGNKYTGDDYTFETLPVPKIIEAKLQQVADMSAATLRVIWTTNTPVSSVVTYYPEGGSFAAADQIALALTKRHEMILKNLRDDTNYLITIRGKDVAGNELESVTKQVRTSVDFRPPGILNMNVESTIVGVGADAKAQIMVSWDTDEPASTQVEYSQGTSSTYNLSTQESTDLTTNHVVTIPGLNPSNIYHLRSLSKDKSSNIGVSDDFVVTTPKSTRDALNLVIDNLSQTFGFLKNMKQ